MRFDEPFGELSTTSGSTGGKEGIGVLKLDTSDSASDGREEASVASEGLDGAILPGPELPRAGIDASGGGSAKSQGRGTRAAGMILSKRS